MKSLFGYQNNVSNFSLYFILFQFVSGSFLRDTRCGVFFGYLLPMKEKPGVGDVRNSLFRSMQSTTGRIISYPDPTQILPCNWTEIYAQPLDLKRSGYEKTGIVWLGNLLHSPIASFRPRVHIQRGEARIFVGSIIRSRDNPGNANILA